jgi:hypothetical protein
VALRLWKRRFCSLSAGCFPRFYGKTASPLFTISGAGQSFHGMARPGHGEAGLPCGNAGRTVKEMLVKDFGRDNGIPQNGSIMIPGLKKIDSSLRDEIDDSMFLGKTA